MHADSTCTLLTQHALAFKPANGDLFDDCSRQTLPSFPAKGTIKFQKFQVRLPQHCRSTLNNSFAHHLGIRAFIYSFSMIPMISIIMAPPYYGATIYFFPSLALPRQLWRHQLLPVAVPPTGASEVLQPHCFRHHHVCVHTHVR
eukprot:GHVU01015451.1.p2 GENE.GHVU01015451.1~~GHVU01015451.1.p2  ORF type:complete len:144 (-),score=0.12 GHVU01015451.1:224-655(-)